MYRFKKMLVLALLSSLWMTPGWSSPKELRLVYMLGGCLGVKPDLDPSEWAAFRQTAYDIVEDHTQMLQQFYRSFCSKQTFYTFESLVHAEITNRLYVGYGMLRTQRKAENRPVPFFRRPAKDVEVGLLERAMRKARKCFDS